MSEIPSKINLTELAVTPVDHGIAAMLRQLLALGIPIDFLARVMMQHSASLLAFIEPASVRAQAMATLINNFPQMVRRAQLAAASTPGGIILPHAKADALKEVEGA
jgi:hypothetical protein